MATLWQRLRRPTMWATDYPLSFWLFAASALVYVLALGFEHHRDVW
jgi:hypothetical protein